MRLKEKLSLGVAALALAATSPAMAQVVPDEGAQTLDAIIVTAQRRETRLQDTPIAITAVSRQDLANRGVTRVEDLAGAAPSVYVEERSLRTQSISIRGLSADLNNPGLDQSVGLYVDGVYLGRATPGNSALFDLERVEVLRGPQGALYGKNTIAGAINYISRLPGQDLRGGIEAGYGDYDAWNLRGGVSGPIAGDALSAGLSVALARRDGLTQNTATGSDLDDIDSQAYRLTLVGRPSEDVDLIVRGDFSRDRTNSGVSDVLDNGAFAGTPLADADPYDRKVAQDLDPTQNREVWGVSGEVGWRFGGGALTSITAWRGYEWDNYADNDYTVLDMFSSGIREEQEQFSQEIRYAGSAGSLDYVFGGFYFRQQLDTLAISTIGPDLGVYPVPTDVTISGDVTTDSYALFAHGDYSFNDRWSLTVGLRYTTEDKKVVHSQVGDPFGALLGTYAERTIRSSENDLSPSASLNYKATDRVLLYASYARGFKSGGFNVFSISPTTDARYEPEYVDSYELGAKTSFWGGRALLNAALFRMDYADLQVNQLITVGGVPRFQTSNAAEARSQGLEVEAALRPAAGLELTLNYSYLDAEFVDYRNATSGGADYTGNALARAPRHSGAVSAQYVRDLGSGLELFVRGDVVTRSRIWFGPDNAFDQGSVTLVNGRIGLNLPDKGVGVYLWGRNLGDETYAISRSNGAIVPGQTIQSLGAPRTWGLELKYSF